jgi:uncharacterized protein YndB with AHSA1/START domain
MSGYGTVRQDADGRAVRFERRYEAAPEELWAAWTEPDRIARWLGAAVDGEVAPGSAFTLVWGADADSRVGIAVRELKPPVLLEWEWTINGEPPTLLRVELAPAGTGTVLLLNHSRLPFAQVVGLSAGWHDFLDGLPAGVGGMDDEKFAGLLPAYRERVAALS